MKHRPFALHRKEKNETMSEQLPTGQASAPAEGQAPTHTYIPNHGYASATSKIFPTTPGGYAADIEDESYDDLFEDEEEEYFEDMEYDPGLRRPYKSV